MNYERSAQGDAVSMSSLSVSRHDSTKYAEVCVRDVWPFIRETDFTFRSIDLASALKNEHR